MAASQETMWSPARIDELCALRRTGMKTAIAERLGATKGQVTGYLHRLRQAGDPRVPAAGPSPARGFSDVSALAPIEAMAQLLSEGCPHPMTASHHLRQPSGHALGAPALSYQEGGASMTPPRATAMICDCTECRTLDRAHPREGRQLALISSGERPVSLPLTDPDAPTVVPVDVSAPRAAQSRHMRSRPKPETHTP